MIIFQTAGGGDAGSIGFGDMFSDTNAKATTFRTNAYIHRLNRTLQAEMRAISGYKAALRQLEIDACKLADDAVPMHQSCAKDLINLIILNRGIPEDKTALSIGLTRTFITACRAIPDPVAFKATIGTLRGIERHLVSSYKKLIEEAPRRDLPFIEELLRRALKSSQAVDIYKR
jgi:hypothetical protein